MYRRCLQVCIIFLLSCSKITDDYKTFTIREGKHRSTNALNYSKDTVFGWNIEFDSSAIYKCVDSLNQYDINKLIGWSDEHGEFSFDLIKRVDLCEEHYYELTIFTWNYKLAVDGTYVYVPRNCPQEYRRYQLYPYFGGNEPAPHNINIKIKKGTSF